MGGIVSSPSKGTGTNDTPFMNSVVPMINNDTNTTEKQKSKVSSDIPKLSLFGSKKSKVSDDNLVAAVSNTSASAVTTTKADVPIINVPISNNNNSSNIAMGLLDTVAVAVDVDKDLLPELQASSSPIVKRNMPDKRLSLSTSSVTREDSTTNGVGGVGSGGVGSDFNFSYTEGQTRRSHLADHELACSLIIDHVYVSGRKVVSNREILDQYNIKYIVNCASSIIPNYFLSDESNNSTGNSGNNDNSNNSTAIGEMEMDDDNEDREMMIRCAEGTQPQPQLHTAAGSVSVSVAGTVKGKETNSAVTSLNKTDKKDNSPKPSTTTSASAGGIRYLSLSMVDGRDDDITWFVAQVLHFIQSAVDSQVNVLVHCEKGVSRSCSFVIAYLMWSRRKLKLLTVWVCLVVVTVTVIVRYTVMYNTCTIVYT